MPNDKQYLLTRGVPCLRRATALAYTDEDEDAERLLSFGDLSSTGNEADEWVETHAGRSTGLENGGAVGEIDEIPDVDDHGISGAMGGLSVSGNDEAEIPDMDEIPDMEEDLEGDDEATAAPKPPAVPPKSANSKYVLPLNHTCDERNLNPSRWIGQLKNQQGAIYWQLGRTMS